MRRSVLFTRVFNVVILTIVMTALFTTIIYTYIARSVFTEVKENELLPKARALGSALVRYRDHLKGGDDLVARLMDEDENGNSLLGAYVVITDGSGQVLLSSADIRADYKAAMAEAAQQVLTSGEMRTAQIPSLRRTSMVGVGVPIVQDGRTEGVVLMLVPLYEAMVAMGSLNGALALSLLLALPIVAAMVYYVIGRIVMPLRQMRDVALHMAGGNFDARADISQRGEIGQLGRSLNYLSQELSRSISEMVLERNRLQQTLDGLREGIVAVDQSMRVTHHNPALAKLFSPLNAVEQSDAKLRLIPVPEVWADFEKALKSSAPQLRILPLPDKTLQVSITPLLSEDASLPAGAVGLISDVTESERLERTRRDYVANVSHEMRTPLTAMRALLEPLSEGMVKDEAARRRYYSIMLRETMRLSRLIDDLMELSRLQSGALTMNLTPVVIGDVLLELSGKYEAFAQDHALQFEVNVPKNCPTVLSNQDRLEEVLVILLDNAMKYTHEGGKVAIEASWDEQAVILSVRDTGVGIDPKDQPYVFDRFYKVDKAHTGLGSGLGLSIASELLKLMNEKIYLTSVPGEGSTFYFTLKRA